MAAVWGNGGKLVRVLGGHGWVASCRAGHAYLLPIPTQSNDFHSGGQIRESWHGQSRRDSRTRRLFHVQEQGRYVREVWKVVQRFCSLRQWLRVLLNGGYECTPSEFLPNRLRQRKVKWSRDAQLIKARQL